MAALQTSSQYAHTVNTTRIRGKSKRLKRFALIIIIRIIIIIIIIITFIMRKFHKMFKCA